MALGHSDHGLFGIVGEMTAFVAFFNLVLGIGILSNSFHRKTHCHLRSEPVDLQDAPASAKIRAMSSDKRKQLFPTEFLCQMGPAPVFVRADMSGRFNS